MTSAEKNVSEPPNLEIFWGRITPGPPTKLVPSASDERLNGRFRHYRCYLHDSCSEILLFHTKPEMKHFTHEIKLFNHCTISLNYTALNLNEM